jgi:hypothetical protein
MSVDEVGPCLRYATARVVKAERSSGSRPSQQQDPWSGSQSSSNQQQPEDPPF